MKSVFSLLLVVGGVIFVLNLNSCKSDSRELKTDPNFVVERDTLTERILQEEQKSKPVKSNLIPIHGNWRDSNDPTHLLSLDQRNFVDIQNGKIAVQAELVFHEKCPVNCTDEGKGCFIVKDQCYVITKLEENELAYKIGDKTFSFKRA